MGIEQFPAPEAIPVSPTGVLSPFAGSTAPTGWQLCYGQALSRTAYSALFSVIGTTYGVGDGSTTFNVPDLRGRVVAGTDNMGGSDAGRLPWQNDLGTVGTASKVTDSGAATHTLTSGESGLPAHTHTQDSHNHTQNSHNHTQDSHNHTQNAHTHSGYSAVDWYAQIQGAGAGTGGYPHLPRIGNPAYGQYDQPMSSTTATNNATTATNQAATATNIAATATNQNNTAANASSAHNNMQPTMLLNYIIKT